MKKQSSLYLFLFVVLGFFFVNFSNAAELATKLKGKILLQTEQNGEAWYINPANEKKYYMGRPVDAFSLMRELGVGITNQDLNKIEVNFEGLSGSDNDLDGLHNFIEDSYGTDKDKKDTDEDGYSDGDEVKNGYNPLGDGKLKIDNNFATHQAGKILLQVEQKGEAWYVNPENNKRYYLGRPSDAFNVMRELGLGISDENLNKIAQAIECGLFPDNLKTCSPYKCQFTHMFTGEKMNKEIVGLVDEKCSYVEEMPNNGKMECSYTKSTRETIAQFYGDLTEAETLSFKAHISSSAGEAKSTYTINGKEVENPLQEVLDDGQCVVLGYNDDNTGNTCPSGAIFKGELYTYDKNDNQIAHPLCSDPNVTCPTCENCSSGSYKKVGQMVDGVAQEVCQECLFNSDCNSGYECSDDDKCIIRN